MSVIQNIKLKIKIKCIQLLVKFMNEIEAQKLVFQTFKSEIRTNIIEGFESGKIHAEFKEGFKELVDFKNYKLGLLPQDLQTTINIKTYKDRSVNIVGGRKHGFIRVWANRWQQNVKSTRLLHKQGLIHMNITTVQPNGVQYPPRFKYELK